MKQVLPSKDKWVQITFPDHYVIESMRTMALKDHEGDYYMNFEVFFNK